MNVTHQNMLMAAGQKRLLWCHLLLFPPCGAILKDGGQTGSLGQFRINQTLLITCLLYCKYCLHAGHLSALATWFYFKATKLTKQLVHTCNVSTLERVHGPSSTSCSVCNSVKHCPCEQNNKSSGFGRGRVRSSITKTSDRGHSADVSVSSHPIRTVIF